MNANNGYKYTRLKDFSYLKGEDTTQRSLGMCLSDSLDRTFQYGGEVGSNSGPQNAQCQSFMADKCANKWDGFCEYYYKQCGKDGPSRYQGPNTVWRPGVDKFGLNQPISLGETLLKNTAERKYCEMKNCKSTMVPLNPMDPYSPKVKLYTSYEGCTPVCKVDSKTIDSDPVMDRLLRNPNVGAGTLINICNTAKNENIDLGDTKIGRVCKRYHELNR